MTRRFLALFLLTVATAIPHLHPRAAKYEGFKVYRVATGDQLQDISKKMTGLKYEQWNRDIAHHMDFSLDADDAKRFTKLGLKFRELHENLGAAIALEGAWEPWQGKQDSEGFPDPSWFNTYHDYEDHLQFLEELNAALPNQSTIFVAGKSFEGREQRGIHLFGEDGPGNKPAVLIHGTVHAREWITTMVAEYIAYRLVGASVVDTYLAYDDYYIIPVINPDGFVYTQTAERLWKKNRRPPPDEELEEEDECWGVDLNRNWDIEWDTHAEGSSDDPCDQTYRRTAPASEVEIQTGMAGFADTIGKKQGIQLFLDLYSYSQLMLSPYGFTCNKVPEHNDDYLRLTNWTARAIEFYGSHYEFGPTCLTMYPTNGNSMDYLSEVVGAEWAMAMELRPNGSASDVGFILPPEEIWRTVTETWHGLKVMFSVM